MINHKRIMSVAGHRGDSYNYFENTMRAFELAYGAGADMIETDVRLSSDLTLVLMHDERVDRTTNGSGKVGEMSFSELRALNAGNEISPAKVPTLEELLLFAKDKDLTLNIEIKEYFSNGNEKRATLCIDKVLELVEKYEMGERILINSFDAAALEYVYKKHGKKYMLHGFYPYSEMGNVNLNPDEYLYCACVFQIKSKENFKYLIERGIEVWIGASITQKDVLEYCIQNGAKLVTTNNPRDTIEKINEIAKNTRLA